MGTEVTEKKTDRKYDVLNISSLSLWERAREREAFDLDLSLLIFFPFFRFFIFFNLLSDRV